MQAAGLVVVGAGVRRDLAADAPPSTANKARQSGNGLGVMGTTCPLADVSRPTSLTLFTRQRSRQLPELRLGEQTTGLLSLAANPARLGPGNDFCDAGGCYEQRRAQGLWRWRPSLHDFLDKASRQRSG